MISCARSKGVPPSTMAVLMLSVFTVSIGYGVVLPLSHISLSACSARVAMRGKFPDRLAC